MQGFAVGDKVRFLDIDGCSANGTVEKADDHGLDVRIEKADEAHYNGKLWLIDPEELSRVYLLSPSAPEKPDALNAALIADGVVLEQPAPVNKHAERKARPIFSGCIAYFPDALMEVARVSVIGNEQHNPGQPLHWHYGKSMDHRDCEVRHMIDFDEPDEDDGALHAAKEAWRALANLQTFLEKRDPQLHAKRQAQRERAAKGER